MYRFLTHPFWKGVLGGVFGLAVGLLVWHAWSDHRQIHMLIEYINLQAPKINKLP